MDYVVALDGDIVHGRCVVCLTYVPDKLLLEAEAFAAYLAAFEESATASIEPLALAILDDINNEIVPRWTQVALSRPRGGPDARAHRVIVSDRQPDWDNPRILAQLPGAFSSGPGAGED